ncbi:MAG: glycosyltransferase family 4 protein [Candidatus Daviesbacteria bacterium]|nr:glycosyltransferase family 4 protein [Candidatus Daviesbacteria bacterium]
MKIAIFSPYLDTFGGGEKYMMTIAEALSAGHVVDVLLDKHLFSLGGNYLKNELSKRFDLNLKSVNFIIAPLGKNSSSFSRTYFLKNYDVLFYLTDGSIFFPTAKKNFLHIQSPLIGQPAKSIWGKFKLKGWDLIIYNSRFTKEYSQDNWPLKSEIIYPPVDTSKIKPLKKEKYILSVGRFFGYLRDKKHEVLIKVFKELFEAGSIRDWSLHLVGSAGIGDKDYVENLRDLAKNIPVKFYPNLEYDKLIELYGKSSIYWHAAGFGETDPTKMEHFGISTVEAMAGGVVPVVIGKGGQREIVGDNKSGYLWEGLDELKQLTLKLTEDGKLLEKMAREATKRARDFSKEKFVEKIKNLSK